VIALTSFKEEIYVQSALQARTIGFLPEGVSADELVHAIRGTYAGHSPLSPDADQALVHASLLTPDTPGSDLTERERVVLAFKIEGLNHIQIAGRLKVSPSTTKSHVNNILSWLGVASRTEAVPLVLCNQLAV